MEFKEKYFGDRQIECLLPDELTKLIKNDNLKIYSYPTSERFIGISNPGDEEIVRKILASQVL